MSHIVRRRVKGKEYVYLEETVRWQNTVKKFSIYIGSSDNLKNISEEEIKNKKGNSLILKIVKYLIDNSYLFYTYSCLSKEQLQKLELLRFGYVTVLKKYYPSENKKYEENFYTKYVHGTTAIEGNTFTLRETDLLLNQGITVGGKEAREAHEIENYTELKNFLTKHKGNLSEKLIKQMNEIIQRGIDDNTAGDYRNIDVGIRGSECEPTPSVLVPDEMLKLIEDYKVKCKENLHPLELSCWIHHRFTQIHPFVDGNGRVAREISNFILRKKKFPPLLIKKTQREEYLEALSIADRGNLKPLVNFFFELLISEHISIIKNALPDLGKAIGSIRSEKKQK